MNPNIYVHNYHLKSVDFFKNEDPQLFRLRDQTYVYTSPLLTSLPRQPGIFTLGGGRQIGKTTLLKQWMLQLMNDGVDPNSIRFFTGELIDDHHQMIRELEAALREMPNDKLAFILIDEVSYILDWDKAIKFLADANRLSGCVLVLTGSDLLMIQEARMRFPGRRGPHPHLDFHFHPLSFGETVRLKTKKQPQDLDDARLLAHFEEYLRHGGFLTAINELAKGGSISVSTYRIYSDWIRGDILKKGKQEHYLRAIVTGVIKRYGGLLTWSNLSKELPIEHPATIADYIELLARMDVVFIMESLREDKLTGAPKKARKVFFCDPFILSSLSDWVSAGLMLSDPETKGHVVEGVVAAHFRRIHPTFVIHAVGEVDVAYVKTKIIHPIEVKWTGQIRPKDLKQIRKYPNGLVWSKESNPDSQPPRHFLPRELCKIG